MSRADGLYEAAGLVSGFLLRYPGDTIEDGLVRSALVSLKSELLRQAGFAREHDEGDEHDEEFSESDVEDFVLEIDARLTEVERALTWRGIL